MAGPSGRAGIGKAVDINSLRRTLVRFPESGKAKKKKKTTDLSREPGGKQFANIRNVIKRGAIDAV